MQKGLDSQNEDSKALEMKKKKAFNRFLTLLVKMCLIGFFKWKVMSLEKLITHRQKK